MTDTPQAVQTLTGNDSLVEFAAQQACHEPPRMTVLRGSFVKAARSLNE